MKILAIEGAARRGELVTPHGTVQTPLFMNVATSGAIKGGVSAQDLQDVGCQIMLCNTYHLHVRPSDVVVKNLGGLRGFTNWQGVTLTDSGGFQVYSLANIRKIKEQGVTFNSHLDGAKIEMTPEKSIQIQSNLGSTIAMAFDECVANPARKEYVQRSVERTTRWLERCRDELARLNKNVGTLNPQQWLFGINQGGVYSDVRVAHMKEIAKLELNGYAIGGLAVGESVETMYEIIDTVVPHMPDDKPRYLMGVGTPWNILEAVKRGIDMFDCVMPSRNARHGLVFTAKGIINLNNNKFLTDSAPLDSNCTCPTCRNHSRAYLRHLLKADEMLGSRLAVLHNLHFYNNLMQEIRLNIENQHLADILKKKSRYYNNDCEKCTNY